MGNEKKLFLGRDEDMALLRRMHMRWLDDEFAIPPVALIWGQGGIGKSTLLRHFHDWLSESDFAAWPRMHINWQGLVSPDYLSPVWVLQMFESEIRNQLDWPLEECDQFDDLIEAAQRKLKRHLPQQDVEADQFQQSGDSSRNSEDLLGKGIEAAVVSTAAFIGLPGGPVIYKFGSSIIESLKSRFSGREIDRALSLLTSQERDILQRPEIMRARTIGRDLMKTSRKWRAIISFDTYEHVAAFDSLFREIIAVAGSDVAWIVAGRDDLYDQRSTKGDDGYASEDRTKWMITPIDLRALAKNDLQQMLRLADPSRPPPDGDELNHVYDATRGIPFTMGIASSIWGSGGLVEDIRNEQAGIHRDLVHDMVERYLCHCASDDADRRALAAIAMAAKDLLVLRAMLEPELKIGVSIEARFDELYRRHAALQLTGSDGLHLHDDAAEYFAERLMGEWRKEPWVKEFAGRGADVCRERMRTQSGLTARLTDLCEAKDYIESSASAVRLLHWVNEVEVERLLLLRVVEGLGHNTDLAS